MEIASIFWIFSLRNLSFCKLIQIVICFYQNSIMSFLQKEVKCIQSNTTLNLYVSTYKIVIKVLKFSVYLILWNHPNFGWFIYMPLTCFWGVLIVMTISSFLSMMRCIPSFLCGQAPINYPWHKNNMFYKLYLFQYFSSVIFTYFYLYVR